MRAREDIRRHLLERFGYEPDERELDVISELLTLVETHATVDSVLDDVPAPVFEPRSVS